MSRWSRSMSPAALVLSILALVVATSAGTAYAAVKIGTKQLKNGAVTSAKIKDGTVASLDLRDGGVTSVDVLDGTLGEADISASTRAAFKDVRAYASVDANPSGGNIPQLRAERTRGFTAITEINNNDSGIYCLTLDPALGIDVTKTTVMVGVDVLGTSPTIVARAAWNSTTDCGAGKIRVETFNGNVSYDSLGFTVLIP